MPDPLHTIAVLHQHGLDELARRFAVRAVRHAAYPNLVLLRYNQIESPMAEPVVQECRGLILDEADGWRPVSVPYRKFFNYAEPNAAPIDWATARVYEKLDGSLMTLYRYADRWHVASRNVPDASGAAGAAGFTMADLFWRTFAALGYALPPTDADRCYMLELMTPQTRIVVQHAAARLVLTGCRRMSDGVELPPESAADLGWEVVRTHPLTSLADCLSAADAIDPFRSEGYVVCDAAFHRVKVKAPAVRGHGPPEGLALAPADAGRRAGQRVGRVRELLPRAAADVRRGRGQVRPPVRRDRRRLRPPGRRGRPAGVRRRGA